MASPRATTSLSSAAAATARPRLHRGRRVCACYTRPRGVPRVVKNPVGQAFHESARLGMLAFPDWERGGGTAAAVPRPGRGWQVAGRGRDQPRQPPGAGAWRPPGRGGGGRPGGVPAPAPPPPRWAPAARAPPAAAPPPGAAPRRPGPPGTPGLPVGAVAEGVQALDEPAIRRL